MRLAIISDIHGNLEALQQVLADIDTQHVDETVCLGDCIGYGPQPEEVVNMIRQRHIQVIMGNHEYALAKNDYSSRMNSETRQSLEITRGLLSATSRIFLGDLPAVKHRGDARLVHGCPPDSFTSYLLFPDEERLRKLFASYPERICFFGHTHSLALYSIRRNHVELGTLPGGINHLAPEARYLINVGSVGQPRDRLNNKAKYVIWDAANHIIDNRFVAYDIAVTAKKIIALGLPPYNAERLW